MTDSRRDFLKKSALYAGALAGTTQYHLLDGGQDLYAAANSANYQTLVRPACQIPVIYDVDVAIVGGSCAAVAAAVNAAGKETRVFLMSEESYLGEDICATLRYHEVWEKGPSGVPAFLRPLFSQHSQPTPLQIKNFLDEQMLDARVPFLLSSHPSRVLFDDAGRVMGMVMVNRSGEQIIKCKSIIDASRDGSVLRQANLSLTERKNPYIEYSVMGDKGRPKAKIVHEMNASFYNKNYQFVTYRFEGVPVRNQVEKAKAESLAKSKTWYPGMKDSADVCFYPPAYQVEVQGQSGLESTLLKANQDIFALNGFGIESEKKLKSYLTPSLMAIGEKLGAHVAEKVKARDYGKNLKLEGAASDIHLSRFSIYRDKLEVLSAPKEKLPVFKTVDVVVVGGGTAGAATGVGAAEHGMKTLVIEPLHGLGGIGTVGAISTYWFGYEGGFNKRVDNGVRDIGENHPDMKRMKHRKSWVKTWKMEWYRREIEKLGGEIWFGVSSCGAIVKDKTLQGVVVAGPFGKGIVLAKRVIDATGSSDIAIAAGADYSYTDHEHAAIQGSGVPAMNLLSNREGYNTDWTFIAEFDAFDTTRAFTLSRKQYGPKQKLFDSGKMVQTRERRRIVGDYTIQAMDVITNRTYADTISYHRSNFDSHGYTVDPFFQLKPPNKDAMEASVPLRALLPVGFENIAVTGLGFSAHRDTMPVLRMQRCLQNQGHALGYIAALSIKQRKGFREIDLKPVQAYLKKLGTLPPRLRCSESKEVSDSALDVVIKKLDMKLVGLEKLLLKPEVTFSKLKQVLATSKNQQQRNAAAFILGMHGHGEGMKELMAMVAAYDSWDKGWNFKGMGQFGRSSSPLDDLVIALGRAAEASKDEAIMATLKPLMEKLNSKSEFSHCRAVAIACESIGSHKAAPMLARILTEVSGQTFATRDLNEAKDKVKKGSKDNWTRTNALRELVVARALYRCGDKGQMGESRLKMYAKDLRGHYALHAQAVLEKGKTV